MKELRPQAVRMSKRANVFYLEHVRVMQYQNKVVYRTERTQELHQYVAIPDKNTAFILLGRGTSITDLAVRMLAESNVMVGFCGSGGTPLLGLTDITFLNPQDEYRPPGHAQAWFALWSNEQHRITMGRELLRYRLAWNQKLYPKLGYTIESTLFEGFENRIQSSIDTTQLLLAEAWYVKKLYLVMATFHNMAGFTRDSDGSKKDNALHTRVNSLLSHGNYLAYGYAAVCLHTMGVPYFLPILHGKTRRGALVFDIADLFKDWLVLPAAFEVGAAHQEDKVFRAIIIERAMQYDLLDHAMDFISVLPSKVLTNQ